MTSASASRAPMALQSLGIFDDDDEEVQNEVMPLQPRSSNVSNAYSTLNSLAKTARPLIDPVDLESYGVTKIASVSSDRDWPLHALEDDLDLEEEMAREAAGDHQWGAEPEFPDQEEGDDEEDDGYAEAEVEIGAAAGYSKSVGKATGKSAACARSHVMLDLEDNGLLGEEEDESISPAASTSRTRSYPPLSMIGRDGYNACIDSSDQIRSIPRTIARPIIDLSRTTAASSSGSTSTSNGAYDRAIPKYYPAGHFAAITLDGTSIRFERRKRMRAWKPPPPHFGDETRSTGLLSRPVHQIIESVRAREAEDLVARDEEASARAALLVQRSRNTSASRAAPRDDGRVWVERYRPKRFTELLGDERVHREVMSWLKEWDACVFRKKSRKRPRGDSHASTQKTGPSSYGTPPLEFRDPYDRPQQRVLLISGAPGLGKTTLAHVLAQAAGYGAYELNASDARSAGAVTDTIKSALESGSLKDARPTCLIVDEIDGATGGGVASGAGGEESRGFIKALVDLIEGGKGGRRAKASKGAKGKKSKPLLRPIICICNDLYAPALRSLRPYCRLIRFQKPATNHLVTRLKSICEAEGIWASSRCLSLLAALSQGDIRSCLHVLQLAKLRSLRKIASNERSDGLVEVTEAEIREAGVGVKDGSTNLQTVWAALFKTATPKERARKTAPWEGSALTQHLLSLVQSSGDYNRLLQGCFEHYPNLSFADDGWWRIRSMLDWVAWGSEMQDKAWSNGTFDLMGYVPWSFLKWNTLFANTVNTLPEWPKMDYEHRLKRQAFDEISLELHHSLPPSLQAHFGRDAVARELGPSLMRMLTPDLKPINNQIVRPLERATMISLVNIMLHLSLSFTQDRTEEGILTYRLEPPLEVFTSYDGKKSATVNVGRYAVRAIVMREVEAEKIRRRNGTSEAAAEDEAQMGVGASTSARNALEAYRKNDVNALGMGTTIKRKEEKIALDFFGRPVVLNKIKEASTAAAAAAAAGIPTTILPAPILAARLERDLANGSIQAPSSLLLAPSSLSTKAVRTEEQMTMDSDAPMDSPPLPPKQQQKRLKVHYRHNEGYSNAVRQPIKMSALL